MRKFERTLYRPFRVCFPKCINESPPCISTATGKNPVLATKIVVGLRAIKSRGWR